MRTTEARDLLQSDRAKQSIEAAVQEEMDKWWKQYQFGRWIYERECFRNILYYLGYQWIHFDPEHRQWRRSEMKSWVPKPVTNRYAPTLELIRSAIINAQPSFLVEPSRMDDKTITAARISDDFLKVIQADSQFRKAKRELASWITMTGTAGIGVEFSNSPDYGSVLMPGERCTNCNLQMKPSEIPEDGKCPDCGLTGFVEDMQSAEEMPRGRLLTTTWSPFEMFIDQYTPDMEDQPAVILARSYHIETARRYWSDSIERLEPETSTPLASTFLNTIAAPIPGYSGQGMNERVMMRRLCLPPCEKYPEGLYGVVTGKGKVVEAKKYPYVYGHSGRPYYPVVRAVYGQVPGRFWGKTPANDLAQKQNQRNRFESLFELITMTMASPVWIIPTGSNPSKITGTPGIQVTATPISGLMPSRLQGLGPDASLVQFITKIDEDFEEIANTFAVMKGKNPGQGIRAASAIRTLEERGFGAFGSVFENLEEMYENWALIALEQFRANANSPLVRMVMNEYGRWASQQFSAIDLQPDINLKVESNSVRPKSSASKMDTIQRLVAMGAVSPQYPEQRIRILEESGMMSLIPGIDKDKEYAMKENAMFMQWAKAQTQLLLNAQDPQAGAESQQEPPPIEVNSLVDEHITHFIQHRRFAMSEEYRMLPSQFRSWFETEHMAGHLDAYQAQMALGGVPGGMSPVPFGMAPPQQAGQSAGTAGPPKKKSSSPSKGASGGL